MSAFASLHPLEAVSVKNNIKLFPAEKSDARCLRPPVAFDVSYNTAFCLKVISNVIELRVRSIYKK